MSKIHWSTAVSADFNTAADWSTSTVPGAADDAILDASGKTAYTVTASTSETVKSIQTAATATLSITAGTFNATTGTGTGANAGTIAVGANAAFQVGGTVTNNGVISLSNTASFATLNVGSGGVSLTGAGQVTLTDNAANFIVGTGGVQTLTNVDNTISGAGFIGGGNLILNNQAKGVIDSTGTANALTLDMGFGTATNAGLIESTGKGGLVLQNGSIANSGQITVSGGGALSLANMTIDDSKGGTLDPGLALSLNSSAIVGGSLTMAAGGTITIVNNDDLNTALTNKGAINVGANAQVALHGTVTNNGVISLSNTASFATLNVGSGGVSLTGAGQVTLTDNAANFIVGTGGVQTLTNVDNTISGAGFIGGGNLILNNQAKGVIDSTGTANALTLDMGFGTATNAGLIESTGKGGLVLQNGSIANSGQITVSGGGALSLANMTIDDSKGGTLDPGLALSLNSSAIVGGSLTMAAGGTITIVNNDDLNTALTNKGAINVGANAQVALHGTVTNNGVISLSNTASFATLNVGSGGVSLTGAGQVTLTDNAANFIVGTGGVQTLTNVDNTISGAGFIGGGNLILNNQAKGVIDSTGTANALTLDMGFGTATNAGLIESTGKGGLVLQNGSIANSGQITVSGGGALSLANMTIDDSKGGTLDPGLALSLNSSAIVGGSLTMAAGGTITIVNNDDLNTALTNKGAINVGANAQVALHGTVTNNGVISLSNTASFATLNVGSGGVSLTGAGQVTLTDNAANFIVGTGGVQTLTNVDNTISGAGFIGGGNLILNNQAKGIINSTGTANALTLDMGFGTATNAGLIESTGKGGLTLQNGAVTGKGGTISVGAGSSVRLQAVALTGGAVATASGGVITIGNGSTAAIDAVTANAGQIVLASTGAATSLVFDKSTSLTGGGSILLGDNANNIVTGKGGKVVLTNVDNMISGSGQLGARKLTLVNQAGGVIDASGALLFTIDTGKKTITNAGLIEATGAGGGVIQSVVKNTGILAAAGGDLTVKGVVTGSGSASVNGATLDFTSSFSENVSFTGSSGVLELAQSQTYTGKVSGFSKIGGTSLDLRDIAFTGAGEASFSGDKHSGVLTVSDGAHTATITLTGDYTGVTFVASSDHRGGVSITNTTPAPRPAVAPFAAAMASLGASGASPVHTSEAAHTFAHPLIAPRAHYA